MTPAVTRARKTVFGLLAAGAACATVAIPVAGAAPEDDPTPPPAPAAAADACNASTMASTISTVTSKLSTYFAAHPDANEALIDATRQPAFVAAGQFDDYTKAHPDQATELREIQAPLTAYKDRCGLQVSPTDALTVLAAL
jgi:hemophore-related protein